MEYEIVELEPCWLEQLEELEKQCFSVPWTREMLLHELISEHSVFLGAVSDGELLGYVSMMFVLDEGYISNVAVSEKYRRQGIGRSLIRKLTERAKELKLSFMTLEVRKSNIPAIALYSDYGFKPVGERKDYYEKPRESALLMTKLLSE